ncbi:MAG: ABC transporter permease [Dehalococcoidales bacterium]|jgi:ABC-type dipeptide/oligopeptide/nickel transport system permease subunit|nr:ABC transporter permease [Dehalococcoidales bacterium]
MADNEIAIDQLQESPPRISELKRFVRVFLNRWLVAFGMIIILLFLLTAAFAPWIAPYDPYETNYNQILQAPDRHHLLGTDTLGRDVLSRIIFGARTTLMVGVIALGIAAIIGMFIGLIAGYFGGLTYSVIMRIIDAMMAFPMILLALVIAALLGGGLRNVMIALGISLIPGYVRLMCGQVLAVKTSDYILAEKSIGASDLRIMLKHVFPNCIPPLIVMVTLMMGSTILAEAGLSYLGIGIEAPAAAWGGMISDGYTRLLTNPILSVAPGVAIMLVVFAFNMVGDGLRDALDPRLRGTI